MEAKSYDVVVVGGGNAALCAALSACQQGARAAVFERAPEEERGGNSGFTGGGMRFVYENSEEIYKLVPDLSAEEIANSDFGSYTEAQFFEDLYRLTQYRTDANLAEVLIKNSNQTVHWLRGLGVRFLPGYGAYAPKVNGKFKFSSGSTLFAAGAGRGLVDALYTAAGRANIDVYYDARVHELLHDDRGVRGVEVRLAGTSTQIRSRAVVLACGGFEANTEWRTRYLGRGWDLAKVRGTRFNTGDGLKMALDAGAQSYGNWSGAHAACQDLNAAPFGDVAHGERSHSKYRYPYGIMVNAEGRRFVDEGADFHILTYAKYGRIILEQPEHFAWQIFDSKVLSLLGPLYQIKGTTKLRADTLSELATKLEGEGVNRNGFLKNVAEYNAAVMNDIPFNPGIRDGRSTQGLEIPKTNWAQTISDGPFEAYAVTCGITFTFGGLKITTQAQVVDSDDKPIRGLYAAGECVGGLFYFNYPGGSGLMGGAVFGRIAGKNAADCSKVS